MIKHITVVAFLGLTACNNSYHPPGADESLAQNTENTIDTELRQIDKRISIEDAAFNDYFFQEGNIPTVRGKILNMSDKRIEKTKINYTIVTPFRQSQTSKNCSINSDGTFELELDYAFPYQQIWFDIDRVFYAGLYAHTDLFVELDARVQKFKIGGGRFNGTGIRYLGTDGELNSYMNNHVLFKRRTQLEIDKAINNLHDDRNIDYGTFIQAYDSLYAILQHLDEQFIEKNPSEYSWMVINERQSAYYGDLCVKHWGKEMEPDLFNEMKSHKAYLTSNNGMSFYNYLYDYIDIKSNKEFKRDYRAYKSYSEIVPENVSILDSLIHMDLLLEKLEPIDSAKYELLYKQANLLLHDTLVVDQTLETINRLDIEFEQSKADFLKIKIESRDIEEDYLKKQVVLSKIETDWCKSIINNQHDKVETKLAAINEVLTMAKPLDSDFVLGQPIAEMPSGARLYKVDELESKQLLANLKSSFEDKAIVIDFWATWCAPCLEEMPHSKQLYDEVKDLPIKFVYLCTSNNSNEKKWRSKIAEYDLNGTHIFVDSHIMNELMNLFSVSGFPSYAFIDSYGEYQPGAIDRMSHLSKEKLTKLIEE